METTNINTSCFKSNVYYSFGQLIKKCQSPFWNLKHFPLHKRFPFILSFCVNYFFVLLLSTLLSLFPSLALLFLYVPEGGTVYTRSPTDANKPHLNGRAMCQILTHKHMQTLHGKKSHQDILILFGCSPPLSCASASQPHTQHFSYDFTYRLGKITPLYTMSAKSGVPHSWFGHRWLKDMSYKERVCAVVEETKKKSSRSYLIKKCLCELKSK